ncbi:hypothetical protein VNO77_03462 [Canavalia gladiata]|uniref:Uncharacterized protein n=1 Tax=Canavalia gladiata TaxID=3824 RepID=A0AAN9MUR2_CANGL
MALARYGGPLFEQDQRQHGLRLVSTTACAWLASTWTSEIWSFSHSYASAFSYPYCLRHSTENHSDHISLEWNKEYSKRRPLKCIHTVTVCMRYIVNYHPNPLEVLIGHDEHGLGRKDHTAFLSLWPMHCLQSKT